jgi:hypothetical protein
MKITDWLKDNPVSVGLIIGGILLIYSYLQPFIALDLLGPKSQVVIHLLCLSFGVIALTIGSAIGARDLRKMRIPHKYRPPYKLEHNLLKNMNCDIMHADSSSVITYSAYANNIKDKNKPKNIFTVCAFEPYEILSFILPEWNRHLRNNNHEIIPNINGIMARPEREFKEIADSVFPHFKNFSDFHDNATGVINRLLILRDEMALARNPKWMFEKFKILNGNVPCSVAYRNILEKQGISFLTDFVVYNEEFLMDYYSDSSTFILSFLKQKESPVRHHLFGLIEHYKEYRTNLAMYVPLDSQIKLI